MYAPNHFLLYLSLGYSLLLLAANIIFDRVKPFKNLQVKSGGSVFFISFLVRFLPVFFFPFASGYDISSFLGVGQKILEGKDIYTSYSIRYYFAFLPTYGLLTSLMIILSKLTAIPTFIYMKLFIIIFDSAIAVLVAKICKNTGEGLKYIFSPIPVIIGAYLGQFDAIPLFFVLLFAYLIQSNLSLKNFLLLGTGIIFKPWPIILIPLSIFRYRYTGEKITAVIYSFTPVITVILLYNIFIIRANIPIMLGSIIQYESVLGWWGPSIFFKLAADYLHHQKILTIPALISKIMAVSAILLLSMKISKNNSYRNTEQKLPKNDYYGHVKLILLSLYIISFGLSIQYLLWIFPFALITRDKFLKYYSNLFGPYVIIFGILHLLDYNFKPPGIPLPFHYLAGIALWFLFLFWGVKEFSKKYFLSTVDTKPSITTKR